MRKKIIASLLLWILAVLLLALVATASGSAYILVMGAVLFVVPFVSLILNVFVRKKYDVAVTLPITAEKNKTAVGRVSLQSSSNLPGGRCFIVLSVKNSFTGEETETTVSLMALGKRTVTSDFTLNSEHCGYVTVSVKKAFLTDWLGFLPIRVKRTAVAKMSVLPDTFDTDVTIDVPYIAPEDDEAYSNEKSGYDYSEVFQLREYAPGDSLKQIHWKLSAKTDRLVVREASQPVSRSLLIFWDKNTAASSPEQLDAMAETVASVCQAVSQQNIAYTLCWSDGRENSCADIEDTDSLLREIPRMLKKGADTYMSGLEKFMEADSARTFSKTVYFAAEAPGALERFPGGDITAVLCTDTPPECPYRVIAYTPESCIHDMQIIEL